MEEQYFKNENAKEKYVRQYCEKRILRKVKYFIFLSLIIFVGLFITFLFLWFNGYFENNSFAYSLRHFLFENVFGTSGYIPVIFIFITPICLFYLFILLYCMVKFRYKSLSIISYIFFISIAIFLCFMFIPFLYDLILNPNQVWNAFLECLLILLFVIFVLFIVLCTIYSLSNNKFYKEILKLEKYIKKNINNKARRKFVRQLKQFSRHKENEEFFEYFNKLYQKAFIAEEKLSLIDIENVKANEEDLNINCNELLKGLNVKPTNNIIQTDPTIYGQPYAISDVKEDEVYLKKENSFNIFNPIVISIIYLIVLNIAILGVTKVLSTPLMHIYSDDIKDESLLKVLTDCVSTTMGIMYFSYIPTILYYFAFDKRIKFNKKTKIGMFIFGLVMSLAIIGLFFCLYYIPLGKDLSYRDTIQTIDGTAYEHVLTIIVCHIGLVLAYIVSAININTEKLNAFYESCKRKVNNVENQVSDGYMSSKDNFDDEGKERNFFGMIFRFIYKLVKIVTSWVIRLFWLDIKLRDKNITLYYLFWITILTILSYFASFFVLVLAVFLFWALIGLYFNGVLAIVYRYDPPYYEGKVFEVYDNGTTIELEHYNYIYGPAGYDVFTDSSLNKWITNDQGKTFYKYEQ